MANSPNKNHENCIADSKENNYLLDLGSEKAKEPISESRVTMKFEVSMKIMCITDQGCQWFWVFFRQQRLIRQEILKCQFSNIY